MFALKDVTKNKVSSFTIIIMIIISLIGFNIVFDLFFTSLVQYHESKIISNSSKSLNLNFEKNQTSDDINKLIYSIAHNGSNVAYTHDYSFKGDLFDTSAKILAVSNGGMFQYNLLQGRNINQEEIEAGSKVAVISKNYEQWCEKENNQLYINLDNESYKVVGIIGNKYSISYYNLMIFIPYTSAPKAWNSNSILDANLIVSGKTVAINNYKKDYYISNSQFSNLPVQTIRNSLFAIDQHVIYFSIISLISIINIIMFSAYWIDKKKNQIGILKAIGYSNGDTTRLLRNELFILSIISSICASILYYPFSHFFNDNFFDMGLKGSPIIVIADFLFSFISSLLVVSFNKRKIDQLSINDNITNKINFSKKIWVRIVLIIEICLVFNYSAVAWNSLDYVYSTLNNAKKIVNIQNIEVTDPFTVSYDTKLSENYDIQKIFNTLKQNNTIVINYLYSADSSKDVAAMKNASKPYYDPNFLFSYIKTIKSQDVIPLLYIEKDSFKGLKININTNINISDIGNNIPVYAGYDYRKYFSIGDVIKGDSGYNYEIIGFLDNNSHMFSDNISSDALSETNNLNSFIVVPYSIDTIKNLPPGYRMDDFIHYSMTNSFFIYKSSNTEQFITKTLSEIGVHTTLLGNQLKIFTLLNFKYVAYTLFCTLMVLLICLAGLICFVISSILSEKRDIGIKMALGFNKKIIMLEYIYRMAKLLIISLIIIIIKYIISYKMIFTPKNSIDILLMFIFIPIPEIILIFYLINRYVPSELIGGEK